MKIVECHGDVVVRHARDEFRSHDLRLSMNLLVSTNFALIERYDVKGNSLRGT